MIIKKRCDRENCTFQLLRRGEDSLGATTFLGFIKARGNSCFSVQQGGFCLCAMLYNLRFFRRASKQKNYKYFISEFN